MNLFKEIVYTYLITVLSVIVHELAHLITALVIKLKVQRFVLGEEFLSIEIKRVRISPIILSGFVEINVDELSNKSKKEIFLFFTSGAIINMILVVLGVCLIKVFKLSKIIIEVNIVIAVYSMIPLKFLNSDGYKLIKYLKNK